MFVLDDRLKSGLMDVGELPGSLVLMMPDSDNPWLVLVPQVKDATEIHHLDESQQTLLLKNINFVSKLLEKNFNPDKINIGALGNVVPQLHIHIICRYRGDRAWPGPIWGTQGAREETILQERLDLLQKALQKS